MVRVLALVGLMSWFVALNFCARPTFSQVTVSNAERLQNNNAQEHAWVQVPTSASAESHSNWLNDLTENSPPPKVEVCRWTTLPWFNDNLCWDRILSDQKQPVDPNPFEPNSPSNSTDAPVIGVRPSTDGYFASLHEKLNQIDGSKFPIAGMIKPTVYFIPIVSARTCSQVGRFYDVDKGSWEQICSRDLQECLLQGTCLAHLPEGKILYNFAGFKGRHLALKRVNQKRCPYGFGVGQVCLDPFYTLAADARYFKAGTVVFVPKIRGLILPNGQRHHGFFIVRDVGGAIKGYGRKDFFSGFFHWRDPSNPFHQMHLHSMSTRLPFYRVPEPIAQLVRQARNYPLTPESQETNP